MKIKNFSYIFLLFIYINSFNFKSRLYGLLFIDMIRTNMINVIWKISQKLNSQVQING